MNLFRRGLALLALALAGAAVPAPAAALKVPKLAGSYRCWSFNVDGAGGRCRNPPLELGPAGRYRMSTEEGTYKVEKGALVLSESKFRGSGKIEEGGSRIVFEYVLKGKTYTVTYLRQ